MCRLCLLWLLLIHNQWAQSQNLLEKLDRYNARDSFDWRGLTGWEEGLLERFDKFCMATETLASERNALKSSNSDKYSIFDFRRHLHFVDLNNDQLLDIIYSGPHSGEGDVIHIFMQHEGTFEKVFEEMQSIFRVEWDGEKLSQIFVNDWGCCASPFLTRKIYAVRYDTDNLPEFKEVFKSEELRVDIEKPKTYMNQPIRFNVDNPNYRLRLAPIIDDNTPFNFYDTQGNTMLRLPKGAKGTAYAAKQDETGRVWWYVTIDPGTEISEVIVIFDSTAHLIGWLSSRYVTKFEVDGN